MTRSARFAGVFLGPVCLVCLSSAASGCTPRQAGARSPGAAEGQATSPEQARARVFAALAKTDRRLARRLGVLRGEVARLFPESQAPAELAAIFDFDVRARALAGAHGELTRDAAGRTGAEWLALERLIGEETARVAEERDLPRGASAIVRSLAYELPLRDLHPEHMRAEDEALAATLDRLRGSLEGGSLGAMQLAELDDSLDLFEKRTASLSAAPGAVARLRIALSQVRPSTTESLPPWSATSVRVEAFTGPLPSGLGPSFTSAHAVLRQRIEDKLTETRSSAAERARLSSEAAALLLSPGECPEPAMESRLPAVRAPLERRGLCGLLAGAARGDLTSLVSLDLALDLGRWSLALHKERADPAKTFGVLGTALPLDESDGAHLFRFALAHPVEALTLGWAAALLSGDPAGKAARWRAAGAPRPADVGPLL